MHRRKDLCKKSKHCGMIPIMDQLDYIIFGILFVNEPQ